MKLNILIKKMPIFMCLTKENMLYWSINHLVMMLKRVTILMNLKIKKHIIIKTLMQKHTTNLMSLTTKKRICINRFRKRRNDEKINRIIDDFMYGFAIQLLRSNGLSKHSNNSKPVVVIYGDYKCPYCKN